MRAMALKDLRELDELLSQPTNLTDGARADRAYPYAAGSLGPN
jgi:hypothetical protein